MQVFQRKLLKTSKGISLIEFIISIGICSIIISMILPIFLKFNFLYNKLIINNRNHSYASEALLFIENEINQDTVNTFLNNNKITIEKLDGTTKEIYYRETGESLGNIVITYYKNANSSATNNILTNISEFKFSTKGNLIYLNIITVDGNNIERCLFLKT